MLYTKELIKFLRDYVFDSISFWVVWAQLTHSNTARDEWHTDWMMVVTLNDFIKCFHNYKTSGIVQHDKRNATKFVRNVSAPKFFSPQTLSKSCGVVDRIEVYTNTCFTKTNSNQKEITLQRNNNNNKGPLENEWNGMVNSDSHQ